MTCARLLYDKKQHHLHTRKPNETLAFWTDIVRWTWRRRRRHRAPLSLFYRVPKKAHTMTETLTIPDGGFACVDDDTHTVRWCFTRWKPHHSHYVSVCVWCLVVCCQVSCKCRKSSHLITIHININSIFITLHLPLCGKSFCHFWHTHGTRRVQPNSSGSRSSTLYSSTKKRWLCSTFEVHQLNDPKQNVFTAHDHLLSPRETKKKTQKISLKRQTRSDTKMHTQISAAHSKLTRNCHHFIYSSLSLTLCSTFFVGFFRNSLC